MDKTSLIKCGFTSNEAKIYLTLLKAKIATATKIATLSKIHRRNVYDAINRLCEKGFISYVAKNNKKYYRAVNPQKIVDLFKEKLAFSESILPDLTKLYQKSEEKRTINIFEGPRGIKTFFDDLIREALAKDKQIYIIGATGKAFEKIPFFIERVYSEMIKKQKLHVHTLANPEVNFKKELIRELLKMNKFLILPNSISPTQIFLTGNMVGIMVWSDEPVVIQINDSEIAKGFHKYYKLMKSISKKNIINKTKKIL